MRATLNVSLFKAPRSYSRGTFHREHAECNLWVHWNLTLKAFGIIHGGIAGGTREEKFCRWIETTLMQLACCRFTLETTIPRPYTTLGCTDLTIFYSDASETGIFEKDTGLVCSARCYWPFRGKQPCRERNSSRWKSDLVANSASFPGIISTKTFVHGSRWLLAALFVPPLSLLSHTYALRSVCISSPFCFFARR